MTARRLKILIQHLLDIDGVPDSQAHTIVGNVVEVSGNLHEIETRPQFPCDPRRDVGGLNVQGAI